MNWIRELIYFNDMTDYIIWSKFYLNICIYKFLEKILQKMYLIYPYLDWYLWKIFKFISISEWMNMLIYGQPIPSFAKRGGGAIS